jgi:hypothetical protein
MGDINLEEQFHKDYPFADEVAVVGLVCIPKSNPYAITFDEVIENRGSGACKS